VAAIAVLWGLALARAEPMPRSTGTDADRGAHPVITDADMLRARDRNRAPTEEMLRRQASPASPKIDKLPQPVTRAPVDIEALARGFDAQRQSANLQRAPGPSLMVFISFAMPETALTRLAEQASRAHATLVLRGLVDGSLARTASRVHSVIGTRKTAVQIDPQAFDRYAVAQTPAFVLIQERASATPCATGLCAPAEDYAIVAGDVTLDYALRHIQRTAPRFAKDANSLLKRLER
jgi:conjugal transfer pilus assembly protein TrbC